MCITKNTKLCARENGVCKLLQAFIIHDGIELLNENGDYVKVLAVSQRGINNAEVEYLGEEIILHAYHPVRLPNATEFIYAKDAPGARTNTMTFTFFDFFLEEGCAVMGETGIAYATAGNSGPGIVAHPYFSSRLFLSDVQRFPKHPYLSGVYCLDDAVELRVGSPEKIARFAKADETPEELLKHLEVGVAPSSEISQRAAVQKALFDAIASDEEQ